ncbi:hypothetical protein O3M35_012904 [Rhynocoris fuscipes]|uniref:Uncharacterized protein n=1 Tax=Rhynocoris fuscipes TaxID=488301 RepID=A0AAW1CFH7_9HEMI
MATRRSSRIKQKEEDVGASQSVSSRTVSRQRSIFDIDEESQEVVNKPVIESRLCLSESSDSDDTNDEDKKVVRKDSDEDKQQDDKDLETVMTEEVKPVTELYDFSSILQSQKEISNLAEKLTQQVPLKCSTVKPNTRKRKLETTTADNDIETAGVEDLLKIGEGKRLSTELRNVDVKEESDEEEEEGSNDDDEERSYDEETLETIQVTIQDPNVFNRKKKECNSREAELKRRKNLMKRTIQLSLHKSSIVCLIAAGRFINSVLNTEDLLAVALSMIPSQKYYPPNKTTQSYVSSLLSWFYNKMSKQTPSNDEKLTGNLLEELLSDFECCTARSNKYLVYLFISTARVLGLQCRLVMNLCTLPIRPPHETANPQQKGKEESDLSEESNKLKSVDKLPSKKTISPAKRKVQSTNDDEKKKIKQLKKKDKPSTSKKTDKKKSDIKIKDQPIRRTSLRNKARQEIKKIEEIKEEEDEEEEEEEEGDEEENETDEDEIFDTKKISNRKVLSPDDEKSLNIKKGSKKKTNDVWSEVYIEAEEKWISVDVVHNKINCDLQIFERCTSPVSYILAYNADGTIKDVTKRYVKQWHICSKSRVDQSWWNRTLKSWAPPKTKRNEQEDEELRRKLEEMPMPTSISDFKNHPLYALKRHLLKFEAIYPPSAVPFGQIKGEDIFARACVVELHTKEGWMKQAKVIKAGEEPYKIVKARPKREKGTGRMIKDLPLHLYGRWQVENYVPPAAVDGKVPRNEFGNVELYKPTMLPKGTVHLQLPGLMKVAKKLNIDCAPAVVGWEFSGGGSHPVFDGFIVCKEFKQQLLDAWNKEIENTEKKSIETREKRALSNWNKFIRAIIVRNKLQVKYGFKFKDPSSNSKKKN